MSKADRIAALQKQRAEEYISERVSDWRAQLPAAITGRSIQEDLVENKWEERLQRGGILSIRRFLESPTKFLLLQGPKGLGKSTLGATVGEELIRTHRGSGVYTSLPTLLQEFSFPDRERGNPVWRVTRPEILMLDDVGAATEGISAHQKRSLWSVIDTRWGHSDKVTILTTNMAVTSSADGQGLIDWFGDSAWDRIADSLTHVVFTGESFRGE